MLVPAKRTWLLVLLLVGASPALAAAPRSVSVHVDLFGGASHAAETAGKPVAGSVAIFARPRRSSDALPRTLVYGALPLAKVVTGLKGDPGQPLVAQSRLAGSLQGATDALYVAPTSNGWACLVSREFATCDPGLLPSGIAWHFDTAFGNRLRVFGFVDRDVKTVMLRYGSNERTATLADGVFSVTRPLVVRATRPLPDFGSLVVRYADGRAPATVRLS